jgi:hypothetical protein
MDGIMRFPDATKHEPVIDLWLSQQAPDLGVIAHEWFMRMRECGDDVRELMHDGFPTACVEEAAFAYVASSRSTPTSASLTASISMTQRACWKGPANACAT